MARLGVIDRVKLALREYLGSTPEASALVALVTGQRVVDLPLLREDVLPYGKLQRALELVRDQFDDISNEADRRDLQEVCDRLAAIAQPKGLLVAFCGPSSVGKDVVASEIRADLSAAGRSVEYLAKYTTRDQRGVETSDGAHFEPSSTYRFFGTAAEFWSSDDLFYPYELYDHQYAFSKADLVRTTHGRRNLACILGRFEQIDQFRAEVFRESGRRVYAVLLHAPREQLMRRLLRRHSLPEQEKARRTAAVLHQCEYVEKNKDKLSKQFDLVVSNDNGIPLQKCVDTVMTGILRALL